MCGIFGIVTKEKGDASSPVIEALRRLEYRGYDSSGIAVITEKGLIVRKKAGRIDKLARMVRAPLIGAVGMGHTRWATHGTPTDRNAHPHIDCSGRLSVVHNGIIENDERLRARLKAGGHRFRSDTDTEVIAHLIEAEMKSAASLSTAVGQAARKLVGTYALVVMHSDYPDELIVVRNSSPIIIGVGEDACYVASDAAALLFHTRRVIYLKDGQLARLGPGDVSVRSIAGKTVSHRTESLDLPVDAVEKSGFAHFMRKEISEEPEAVRAALAGRLMSSAGRAKLGGLESVAHGLHGARRIILTACGTAYYAALAGAYMLRKWGGIDAQAELASELRYTMPKTTDGDVLFVVSQSGETADTLAVLKEAQRRGILTCGIVNVVGSSIARHTDAGVYTHAGPEIGVASTKAFMAQLTALALLTLFMGRERGLSATEGRRIAAGLTAIPGQMRRIIRRSPDMRRIAHLLTRNEHALFLGRGISYPAALEGALKLKEVSYIHAEGYGAGELKHGPIALIDRSLPTVVVAPKDDVHIKTLSNISEIRARRGPVIAVVTSGDRQIARLADHMISVPKTHPMLTPLLTTVPLHILAYEAGVKLDRDVDKPRNLAKSVTVE